MSGDLEIKTADVMLSMHALKGDLTDCPLDEAMKHRERIEEIVGLGNGLLLLWDKVEMEKDGMDEINLLREAGL